MNVPVAAHEAGRLVGANRYLKTISYGNDTPYLPAVGQPGSAVPTQWDFLLVVDYGDHDPSDPQPAEATSWPCRPDPFSTYRSGFEVRTYRTARRFLMFHQFPELGGDPVLVRSTDLGYAASADPASGLPVHTLLNSVTRTGWYRPAGQSGYQTRQLPPLELGYSAFKLGTQLRTADPGSLENVTGDTGPRGGTWVDLDGEGLPGLLSVDATAWYYKRNVSAWNPDGPDPVARLEPLVKVADLPAPVHPNTSGGRALQLASLNGDGRLAAVSFAPPLARWYERSDDSQPGPGWSPFRLFETTAQVNWSSPDLRMVDLDGDGLADVLITGDEVFTWYRWRPDVGFSGPGTVRRPFDEDTGPALVFADGTGSIYLADMSGDGLSDLVRVRNGEICYWPNLGFGRFGAKVTMDGAPLFDADDQFDQRRLRLADIDGSGTSDLVYLGARAITAYFNQSGNAWTAGTELAAFPATDDVSAVAVVDLLGSGTGCLVWTSPLPGDSADPLRYLELVDGTKPYLLTSVANNLGAVTTLSYAPSTSCYVQDELAGTPWLTRLPFPVQVLVRVQADDLVSRTRLVSTYTYHHGYYDGVEREFRGFARVDSCDADHVPADSGTGQFSQTPELDGDSFALPPVWARTWYHTGAWLGSGDLAAALAAEYYDLDPQAPRLGPTALPAGLTAEETRQACRALRGLMLHQEVYADDGQPQGIHPYSTTEHRYQVTLVQPPAYRDASGGPAGPDGQSAYGSFYACELESLTCHYERDPADPLVGHSLTLHVDPLGNVTRSATVGYPRRNPAFGEQAATLLTYTEHDVINVTDQDSWYRIGLPTQTRVYELTGVSPASGPSSTLEPC